jgi:hypothetical protein
VSIWYKNAWDHHRITQEKPMPALTLKLDGDNAWPDLPNRTVHHVTGMFEIAGLAGGMESGKPSIAIRLDLDDGSSVVAETSLALFLMAADAFKAKYGDPRT